MGRPHQLKIYRNKKSTFRAAQTKEKKKKMMTKKSIRSSRFSVAQMKTGGTWSCG
jgi:hypothetical protein